MMILGTYGSYGSTPYDFGTGIGYSAVTISTNGASSTVYLTSSRGRFTCASTLNLFLPKLRMPKNWRWYDVFRTYIPLKLLPLLRGLKPIIRLCNIQPSRAEKNRSKRKAAIQKIYRSLSND